MGGNSLNDDKGPTLLILTCILTSLAIITTSLRCWVRWVNRQLGLDDGAMALTTALAVARMSIQIVSVRYGNGKHRHYVSNHDYQIINMLTCLDLFLILRIKDTRTFRYILGTVVTGLILTNFECLVVLLAECSPLKAYWNGTSADHCWPAKVRIYSIYLQASYAVATDVVCTILPIHVVWNVKIPFSTKAAVCGLMSLGLVATVCSAIRAASLGTTTDDLSYTYCIAAIWANTELLLGIIAANLALSRSIHKYFTERARTLTSNASGSRTTHLRNSFVTPTRMGYVKSPEPTSAVENAGSPRSEASAIPLRSYRNGGVGDGMNGFEKEVRC
ncbi:hypothetical protein QM012_001176 [Aureobasidium pullulans]|uniref:Rhodopsin domain-containing protein n=1 Tax=Aureobasidium pullulans TaxID=5580 RepID=A0ABR0TFV5_AURPU